MRLLRAEWRRLFARRFTRWMLLFTFLALATIAGVAAANSTKHDAAALAEAEREAADLQQDCERHRQEAGGEFSCEGYEPEGFLPYQFDFRDEMQVYLMVFGAVLALFALLVGASFIGAEWRTGGMTNLLLWRPQRLRVLGSKFVALLAGVLLVAIVLGAGWIGGFWLIAKYRGVIGDPTQGWWESLGLTGARAGALILAAAALGFALASLGRHTAAALGVAAGYAVLVEFGARLVISFIGAPRRPDQYFLSSHLIAWLNKEVALYDWFTPCTERGCEPVRYVLTMTDAAIVFGSILVVLLGLAFWTFRRRDVT